jgi:hypothetical protein
MSFLLPSRDSIYKNDSLIGFWKVSKMKTPEMTFDLDNITTSRETFFFKFKEQAERWTPSDSLGADFAFNALMASLRSMSLTFKKNNVFSMKISNDIEIVDGRYRFNEATNDLILVDKNDTLQYKVLSISDSSLVIIMPGDVTQQPVVTYKKQR